MLMYIHKERISEAVAAINREATEAKNRGDYDTFFELSHKALDLVNNWIKNQEKESKDRMKCFEINISPKDEIKNGTAFNHLGFAIPRMNEGKINTILNVV